jgi:hypothetical protein
MKIFFLSITIAMALCFASCEGFDASDILDRLDQLENELNELKNGNNKGDGQDDDNNDDKKNVITFQDSTAKSICTFYWDENDDGELSYDEAAAVTDLGIAFKGSSMLIFNELKYFTGITTIADNAFSGCVSLAEITLPEQIEIIGSSAFSGCSNLKELVIPERVEEIGKGIVSGSANLIIYCKPTKKPAIYYDSNYSANSTFPLYSGLTIYVPRNSYNSYIQYNGYTVGPVADPDNWYSYHNIIKPYDFE